MLRLTGPIIILSMFGCASAPKVIAPENIPLVSMHPESEFPPSVSTSVNQNVDLNLYLRIAIVGITHHSVPTLETMIKEHEDEKAKGSLELKLNEISARATGDSLAYPAFTEMTNATEQWHNDLWNTQTKVLIEDYAANELFINRITYDTYESLFMKHGFDVIERDRINEVLQELNLSESGLIDDASAVAAGKLLAAQAVCLIEIYDVDGDWFEPPNPKISVSRTTLKLVIVETGQIALSGMSQNTVNGAEIMFYSLATKLLALYNQPKN